MVDSNAIRIRVELETALAHDSSPLTALENVGPVLLEVLTSERAVALNRAAAADPSAVLGTALAQAGRETVVSLICKALERAYDAKLLAFDDTQSAADLYLSLLIGDLQIRRVTGQMPAPDATQIKLRSQHALDILKRVLAP